MRRIDTRSPAVFFARCGAKTKVTDLIRGLYFDTVNNYSVALRCSCEAFGVRPLMWGLTFPI